MTEISTFHLFLQERDRFTFGKKRFHFIFLRRHPWPWIFSFYMKCLHFTFFCSKKRLIYQAENEGFTFKKSGAFTRRNSPKNIQKFLHFTFFWQKTGQFTLGTKRFHFFFSLKFVCLEFWTFLWKVYILLFFTQKKDDIAGRKWRFHFLIILRVY